jgi:hypothetical protein
LSICNNNPKCREDLKNADSPFDVFSFSFSIFLWILSDGGSLGLLFFLVTAVGGDWSSENDNSFLSNLF